MVDGKSKAQFVCGIIVLLCGILMVVIRLHGWAVGEEKILGPGLGVAVVLLCCGTVLMAVSHHRKDAK
jgi:glucose uptake protein GlcU